MPWPLTLAERLSGGGTAQVCVHIVAPPVSIHDIGELGFELRSDPLLMNTRDFCDANLLLEGGEASDIWLVSLGVAECDRAGIYPTTGDQLPVLGRVVGIVVAYAGGAQSPRKLVRSLRLVLTWPLSPNIW